MASAPDRRPIGARSHPLSHRLAAFLARLGLSPNAISMMSMVFAAGAGLCLAQTRAHDRWFWWLAAAVLIVLRLLANMLDGMVAVEFNRGSPLGELFNEAPDRFSDALIFIGAGFAAGSSPHLGYLAALLAVLTAYIRTLGNQMGVHHLFIGPCAKAQRMWALVALLIYRGLAPWQPPHLLAWGLGVISLCTLLTIFRRLQKIIREVQA